MIKQERYISPEVLKDVQQERASDIENEPNPVGRIEYLGTNGRPGEVIEYTDPEQFIKNIEDETFYGVPFTVVLYRDEQGNTIPQDFLSELDPPPKGFRVEDAPVIDLEEEAPSVDEAEESPFVAQVMRDVEAIAAEEESYERFSVIETENGYAVWDDIRDEIYVDDEGVSEEFTSEWQANDYLQEVKKRFLPKNLRSGCTMNALNLKQHRNRFIRWVTLFFWREKHTISLPLELLMYSCCLQEWCTQFIGRKAKRILNAF